MKDKGIVALAIVPSKGSVTVCGTTRRSRKVLLVSVAGLLQVVTVPRWLKIFIICTHYIM